MKEGLSDGDELTLDSARSNINRMLTIFLRIYKDITDLTNANIVPSD